MVQFLLKQDYLQFSYTLNNCWKISTEIAFKSVNNRRSNFLKIIIISLLTFFLTQKAYGQTDKQHYVFHGVTNEKETEEYSHSISTFGQLDQFRFLNERRIIKFSNSQVSIELFSAEELEKKYGKQISPLTIFEKDKAQKIAFEVTPNGSIKPQFID